MVDKRYIGLLYCGNISILEFNYAKSLFSQNEFIQSLPRPLISLERIPSTTFGLDNKYDNSILLDYIVYIPDYIKKIDYRYTDYVNQNLSLVYLGAGIKYDRFGLYSSKLHGVTFSNVRRFNTEFILLGTQSEILTENMQLIKADFLEVFDYLKYNNPLYQDFIIPKSQFDFNDWLFSAIDKYRSKNRIIINNQDDDNSFLFKKMGDEKMIRLTVSTKEENIIFIYVSFEEALALMFSLLFPNGPVPKISGKTFRQRAIVLLSCKYFRIGLVACSMILYIYIRYYN